MVVTGVSRLWSDGFIDNDDCAMARQEIAAKTRAKQKRDLEARITSSEFRGGKRAKFAKSTMLRSSS
jgi:hypothetical protein